MNQLKVYAIDGIVPVVDPTAYVHPSAVLIGDVIVGPDCYVGPCASLRGDFGRLILERGSNLQDTCVMHGFPGTDTVVEEDGHIGHGAVLHGCRVGRNALVGMNAVIMDNAVIGESSIVAAAAFVKAGVEMPPRMLIAGMRPRRSARSPRRRCAGRAREPRPTRTSPAAAWHDGRDRAARGGRARAQAHPHAGRGAAGGTAQAGRLRPAAHAGRHGHERVPHAPAPVAARRPAEEAGGAQAAPRSGSASWKRARRRGDASGVRPSARRR